MNDTIRDTSVNFSSGLEAAWINLITFVPKFVFFLAILVVGYFVAKLAGRLLNALLERLRFDDLVERGGIRKALSRTGWEASDILAKLLFYTVFLFVLQLAFGIFGPNPISALLTTMIAFLPNILVALIIVIISAAVANGVKNLVSATLGGLSYGKTVARAAAALVMIVGVFAALNQVQIAPAIVNGVFYAGLAIIAGSAIIAIGGGGIVPMRGQWEKALRKMEDEAPRFKEQVEKNLPAATTSRRAGVYTPNPAYNATIPKM